MIERGDRAAVIGKNGSGKTTLLQVLSGILKPTNGSIQKNPQLRIGYFMQELDNLNMHHTILEEILTIPEMGQAEARTILASFLFRREDVYKSIQQLSMGERCRVAFVKLYFLDANLLILDEPTNYLDIATREKIEEALDAYEGSIIVVSHDSYLLRRLSNKVISLQNHQVKTYLGSFREWEKRNENPSLSIGENTEKYLLELQMLALLGQDENDLSEEEKQNRIEKIRNVENQLEGFS
ncbi:MULTISPECIES: ATP-binding cassette domain-containing protein [Bacillus]|uniref:ATP-binding cassette domain-containing protein n=1 Tax=Bacillus TaxID=1386 RepID=UPI0002F42D47|nr:MULTISPECIES: ATP-binding cassette domain-containing protein [Bacillus]